jgi:hypothetical protein
VQHRREHGAAVDHRRVDHLALSGALRLPHRGDHAERQECATATEVAEHIDRRYRALAVACARAERPREGDVVDVVPGARGERAVLAPTGHPAVHQARVAVEAVGGADSEAFRHPWPVALDERVGPLHQAEHDLASRRVLHVHHH